MKEIRTEDHIEGAKLLPPEKEKIVIHDEEKTQKEYREDEKNYPLNCYDVKK